MDYFEKVKARINRATRIANSHITDYIIYCEDSFCNEDVDILIIHECAVSFGSIKEKPIGIPLTDSEIKALRKIAEERIKQLEKTTLNRI